MAQFLHGRVQFSPLPGRNIHGLFGGYPPHDNPAVRCVSEYVSRMEREVVRHVRKTPSQIQAEKRFALNYLAWIRNRTMRTKILKGSIQDRLCFTVDQQKTQVFKASHSVAI